MEPPAVLEQSPKALGEQLAPRPPTLPPDSVQQQERNEDVAMEDAPEENKNIAETPKEKKQVKWKEEEPEKKVQRKQQTPEKL